MHDAAFPSPPRLRWPPLPPLAALLEAPLPTLLPTGGEVVLVAASLDWPEALQRRLAGTLSAREEARARRYAHDALRERWSAGRGLLRTLLGAALGVPPFALRFATGEHGKPALEPALAPPGPPLTFNVSHSQNVGLYALARGREVGVDVEGVRARRSDDVARRFFHARESEALRAIPDEEARREAFFGVWCGKEAFLKATGAGLSQSLSSFELGLGPRGPERVAWHRDDPRAPERWSVHHPEPAVGFRAALIAEGTVSSLRCFALQP